MSLDGADGRPEAQMANFCRLRRPAEIDQQAQMAEKDCSKPRWQEKNPDGLTSVGSDDLKRLPKPRWPEVRCI